MTSTDLDKVLKESRTLLLFAGERYQITYNKPSKFSNSQLAILFEPPEQDRVDEKRPITMMVAPPGSRYILDDTVNKEELMALGWKKR